MAKKSTSMSARHATPKKSQRKPRQVVRPAQQFDPELDNRPVQPAAEERPRPAISTRPLGPRSRARAALQRLPTDYRYVSQDLKKIAILAGVLIVVMIALTFVVK